jgi:hypothetical protein
MACAEPTYNETGELEDGGADLNMGGVCTYYHDLIYLSAFVQIVAIFTDRAWLSFGVVRANMPACQKSPWPLLHCAIFCATCWFRTWIGSTRYYAAGACTAV